MDAMLGIRPALISASRRVNGTPSNPTTTARVFSLFLNVSESATLFSFPIPFVVPHGARLRTLLLTHPPQSYFDPPVGSPSLRRVIRLAGAVAGHGNGPDSRRRDASSHKVAFDHVCPKLGELQIVIPWSKRIGMTLDDHFQIGIPCQSAGKSVEVRVRFRRQIIRVITKEDRRVQV